MKKSLLGVLALLVIVLIFIYVFIPGKINITNTALIHCTPNQVSACLRGPSRWISWWPEQPGPDSAFTHKGFRYTLTRPLTNGADILMLTKNNDSIATNVFLMSQGKDSTAAEWRASIQMSNNPIKRVMQYYEASGARKSIKKVLESLYTYANETKNIYGITPIVEKVKFDFYMSLKKDFNHSPGTLEVYYMIDAIRKFIQEKGALELDHPMLNVMRIDSGKYLAEVAIPTNLQLKDEGEFVLKWMLKGGGMIVADVRGGNATVEESLKQFTQYVNDRRITIMAIPFQSLITDRRQEPDTSKWVTKLYYPVL